MAFGRPFHDESRAATLEALIDRVRAVACGQEFAGYVEVLGESGQDDCLIWSRHERPVARVYLGYDWIRVICAGDYADIRGLGSDPLSVVLDRVEAVVRAHMTTVDALGPRVAGDVSGDEPSGRADRDAHAPDPDPVEWPEKLLDELLSVSRFGPGNIDLPVLLPTIKRWFAQAAPGAPNTGDNVTVELYDWPGDDSTLCAEPPESLPPGEWIGVDFGREISRTTGLTTVGLGGAGVQLWYPTDDDWRAIRPGLDLQPGSVVSFETYGRAGSWSPWLLAYPTVQSILTVAATKPATLAIQWSSVTGEEIEIPAS